MIFSIFFMIYILWSWSFWNCAHCFCFLACKKHLSVQILHSIDKAHRDSIDLSTQNHDSEFSSIDRHKKRNEMPLSQRWYKARQQHLSKAQKQILRNLWPFYGITLHYGEFIDAHLSAFFDNGRSTGPVKEDQYVVMDIGFGNGDSICHMASQSENSRKLFIGCEIYRAGLASALHHIHTHNHSNTVGYNATDDIPSSDDITTCDHSPPSYRPGKGQEQGLQNVRLIRADATMLFEGHVSAASLSEICIFFPDPWPNIPRDLQRRVVRLHMLDLFATCLRPHGLLRVATDVQEYADHVRTTVQQWNQKSSNTGKESMQWRLLQEVVHPAGRNGPSYRPVTRYEMKAAAANRTVWDFEFRLSKS